MQSITDHTVRPSRFPASLESLFLNFSVQLERLCFRRLGAALRGDRALHAESHGEGANGKERLKEGKLFSTCLRPVVVPRYEKCCELYKTNYEEGKAF